MPDDLILVGRVARAHGNKGQVIINPSTDFAEQRFRKGQALLVGPETAAARRHIRDVRFHQGRPIVGFEGVETMNDAEALAGADLWVAAADVEPLPENTYYRHELVGCDVHDRNGASIGKVAAVEGSIERSHLVVQGRRGEVLIPLTAEMVSVDLPSKRITVDPPEGLLELNETG
jgi:16S rRNA processing protein RimM